MKRFVVLALVALLALALALPASAGRPGGSGAAKALLYDSPGYTCPGGALDTSGSVYGFVVMNTNRKGDLLVVVSLKGATPRAIYDIWVNQDPGGCPQGAPVAPAALRTNIRGNGNATVKVPKIEGATHFWVSAVGGGQILRNPAVELD